MKVCD